MPLADQALAVLGSTMRDPNVVPRYQAKIVTVPGSECLWWSGAVSGRGHGCKRAELASRAHLAPRPAMGLASPVPDRCTAVDAAARRGVARAAVRTDTHANRHLDPARRHAPRRPDLHHLASTAGVDAHSVGRPWSASSASPAPRTRDRSDPAEPVHPGYSPAHDLAHTNEPDISARRSMNSSDCRFVLAAAPSCDLADELAAAVLAALLGISALIHRLVCGCSGS